MLGELFHEFRCALLRKYLLELLSSLLIGRPQSEHFGSARNANMALDARALTNDIHDIGQADRDFGPGRHPKGPGPSAAKHDPIVFNANLSLTGKLPVRLRLRPESGPRGRIGEMNHKRSRW